MFIEMGKMKGKDLALDVTVSVLVVTYNSNFDNIVFTLDSIISQQGIKPEIVCSLFVLES
jgi:hypothetical protein